MARQKKVKAVWVGLPSSPSDLKELQQAIIEGSNSKLRVEAERDQLKAVFEEVNEKFGIERRKFNKFVNIYHKQAYASELAENEEMTSEYAALMRDKDSTVHD